MWTIGLFLFKIGQVLGYLIKFKAIIFGVFPMVLPFLKSSKFIIALVVVLALLGTGAYGYIQHQKYSTAVEQTETYKDLLEQRDMELELIQEDIAAKEEILSTLSNKRDYYEWRIESLNDTVSGLLQEVKLASTPEEHQDIQKKVSRSIRNSYNCVMKASGNTSVECNE